MKLIAVLVINNNCLYYWNLLKKVFIKLYLNISYILLVNVRCAISVLPIPIYYDSLKNLFMQKLFNSTLHNLPKGNKNVFKCFF